MYDSVERFNFVLDSFQFGNPLLNEGLVLI